MRFQKCKNSRFCIQHDTKTVDTMGDNNKLNSRNNTRMNYEKVSFFKICTNNYILKNSFILHKFSAEKKQRNNLESLE